MTPDQQQRVAAVVDAIDAVLLEMAELGCDPLESAAALMARGIAEIRDEPNSPEVVATYQALLEAITADLAVRNGGIGSAARH